MRQQLARIDAPAARHAEMEDHGVAAIGIDQPVFGASPKSGHGRAGQPLTEIHRHRAPQVGPAQLHARDSLAFQDGTQATHRGFDFGKFGHTFW